MMVFWVLGLKIFLKFLFWLLISLKPVRTRTGKIHGLCKVHKDIVNNCPPFWPPFWPILFAVNTPVYKLAKFLVLIDYNHGHNFWDFYFFCHRWNGAWLLVITLIHTSYNVEQLKAKDLRKLGILRKISRLYGSTTQCPVFFPNCRFSQYSQKIAEKQKKLYSSCIVLFHVKYRVCLEYFVHD